MKSTIDEPIDLDKPHFDEEATILAARPVVPLDEVTETKRSKGLALALTIGGGLLIGLLAATLIFRYLSVGQPAMVETTVAEQPARVAEQPSVEPSTSAGGSVATVDEATNESSAGADEKPLVAEDIPEPQPEGSRTVRTPDRPLEVEPRRPAVVRDAPRPADDEEDEDEEVDRAMRRSQRQEERRERRRAVREARRQQLPTTDDLTRIREIFEGTPRP